MSAYETGALLSADLPAGQRAYYEALLLETLRMKSILVPFTTAKEDFAARNTGSMVYTEVFDLEPNWNPLSESTIWMQGAHLDSRSIAISLEIHGDTIKLSDYNQLVNFWNSGDLRGLCKGKLGQSQVDYLDILARNAFLTSPYKSYVGATGRFDLAQTDVFTPASAELARIHLEEREVPGVAMSEDGAIRPIVCAVSPRVGHDIRTAAGTQWMDVQNYHATGRKFTGEIGTWGGVRFVKTNRMRLYNYGLVTLQTTLNGATAAGEGAATSVDGFTVGQSGAKDYVVVTDESGFVAGDIVTIHSQSVKDNDGTGKFAPSLADGTQETRRVITVDAGANKLKFDRPLMKAHLTGDYVTNGVTLHTSIFMGGPAVVYGVGERPHPLVLPKIDDLGMIQRFSWRAFIKMQMFRPEYLEVFWSGGSTN